MDQKVIELSLHVDISPLLAAGLSELDATSEAMAELIDVLSDYKTQQLKAGQLRANPVLLGSPNALGGINFEETENGEKENEDSGAST